MNIALPALIAFLLLLPGFIFRTRLKRSERTSLDFSPFGQVVAEAVLWSLMAHLAWLALSAVVFGQRFEPLVLMELLSSAPAIQADATVAVAAGFGWIAAYFVSLFLASFVLPTMARLIISRYRLDRSTAPLGPFFRFHDAPWYYLLTGADFKDEDAPDFIIVSAVVEIAKEAVLYVGVLDEFFVDAEGQLDRMVLQGVSRRPMVADKPGPDAAEASDSERFYEVDGDSFVLRYSETITLNVQYVKITEEQGTA
ncbi:hypothetical protein F2P45_31510 [Massilia sp. CCM 8733]|uniref:Uncharacterized protein n=1 Tax=Massilia mucilaginosa TaxID=2609282 RepID=A0ABX0P339_9BURK|nr:hypothetical protein [Massilia mucilaginosa]NHZ93497.1 hypothetical protein [Massilia mucilaginosa]